MYLFFINKKDQRRREGFKKEMYTPEINGSQNLLLDPKQKLILRKNERTFINNFCLFTPLWKSL